MFSENTVFIVFSETHSSSIQKLYVEQNRKFMKHSGWVLDMEKGCFCLFLFQVLMLLWFVFCCVSDKRAGVLNMFVFPSFGDWRGGLLLFIWIWKV